MIGVYDLLDRNRYCCPDRPAILCGEDRWTYRELNRRVDFLACGLKKQGVYKGSHVGILMRNSIYYIALFYALQKLGAVCVPLNARCVDSEVLSCITMAQCTHLAYDRELLMSDGYRALEIWQKEKNIVMLERETSTAFGPGLEQMSTDDNNATEEVQFKERMSEDDEVLMIFTGGTTGKLSAAIHTHQSLLLINLCRFLVSDMVRHDDILLNYAPLFHMGGLIPMMQTLGSGGCLVLMKKYDPLSILRTIEEERVSILRIIPPVLFSSIYEHTKSEHFDLSSVRSLHFAGGLLSVGLGQRIFDVFPRATIYNTYGQSENIVSLQNTVTKEEFMQDPETVTYSGRLLSFSLPQLLNEHGQEISAGEIGELHGHGLGVMSALLTLDGRETSNSARNTGDMFYKKPDGNYICVGRSKDMIKSGGENVYAGEVEGVLMQMPEVSSCAVIGMPDDCWGEIVAAAIVLAPGAILSDEAIKTFCKGKISGFKVPKRFFFMKELPLSSANKVKKSELRQMLAESSAT